MALHGAVAGDMDNPGNSEANTRKQHLADPSGKAGRRATIARNDRERMHAWTATTREPSFGEVPSGSCGVLLTYQLDGSVTDMPWLQRVQRIRVRSWRVGLRDCSYF